MCRMKFMRTSRIRGWLAAGCAVSVLAGCGGLRMEGGKLVSWKHSFKIAPIKGEPWRRTPDVADILASPGDDIIAIKERLAVLSESIIGPSTKQVAQSQEITILADKSVPFAVVKRVMSTICR